MYYFLKASRANGPGMRAVLLLQSPHPHATEAERKCNTHNFPECYSTSADTLFRHICSLGNSIEGITISGEEPFDQYAAVYQLLHSIKTETNLSVMLFTSYSQDAIQAMGKQEILAYIDILYVKHPKQEDASIESSHQNTHFLSHRYTEQDLADVSPAEVIITAEGNVIVSGLYQSIDL